MTSTNAVLQPVSEIPTGRFAPVRVECRSESDTEREVARQLARALSVSEVTARILVGRGLATEDTARSFLYPSLREHLPMPLEIKNIESAAEILLSAVAAKEQITIFSDFDVDGISAGAQLYLYLRELGAVVNNYIPSRFTEGYGLSLPAVEKLAKAGTRLLVTVDCGTTSVAELGRARRLGLKTLVIDHHQTRDVPPADCFVNPAQDGCSFGEYELASAGLVWMLLIVLRAKLVEQGQLEAIPDPKKYLDLAVLGTICDMVPLTLVNRVIALRGVEALRQTERPGLVALKEAAGLAASKVNAGQVSFALGPRINAAGRLGDPNHAFEMLVTDNPKRAEAIATVLHKLNNQRKAIEDKALRACLQMVEQDPSLLQHAALALYGKNFHLGVIGIVAQRMVEQYHRPTAVMTAAESVVNGELTQIVKGSVRSVKGFHVSQALATCGDLLLSHGGHAQAGGFSLLFSNLQAFQQRFTEVADQIFGTEALVRTRKADIEVKFPEIDYTLVNELSLLAPFGIGNPSPVFVTRNVIVENVMSLNGGHLRLRLSDGAVTVSAVGWRFQGHPLLRKNRSVNIAYAPEINSYNGVSSVQLNIKEVWEGEGE